LIVAFSLVGSAVGAVVLGDALIRALLNVITMAKDGTAMTMVDCLCEMTEWATGYLTLKIIFFEREREIRKYNTLYTSYF